MLKKETSLWLQKGEVGERAKKKSKRGNSRRGSDFKKGVKRDVTEGHDRRANRNEDCLVETEGRKHLSRFLLQSPSASQQSTEDGGSSKDSAGML